MIAKKDKQSNAVCRDYILIPATPRAEMVAPMMGDQTGTTRQNVISKDVACNDNDPQCAARQVIGSMAGGSMFGDGMGGLGMGFPGVPGIHTGISGYNEAGGFGDHMGHGGCGGHGGCHGGHGGGGYGGFGSHFFGANDHGYSSFWGGRDDIPNAEYEPLHSEVGSKKGTVSSKKKSKSHKKSFAGGWGGTGYGGYGANGLGGGDITTGEPMFGNRMDAANGEGAFGHNFEGANGWGAFGGQRWGENFAGWGHGYEGGFGGGSNGPLGFGGAEGGAISGRGVGLPSIAGPVEGGEPADGGYGANVDARVLGGRVSGPLGLGGGLGGYGAGVGAGLAGGLGGPLGGLGTAGLGGYGGVGGARYGGYGLGGSALAGDATGYGGVGDTVGAGIGGVGAGTGIGGVGVGGVGVGGVGDGGLGDGCVGNMVNVNSGCGGAGLDGAVGGGGLAGAGAGYGVATGLNTDVGITGTVSSGGHHTKFAFRSKVKGKKAGKAGKKSKVKATTRQDIAMPDEQALMDVTKQRQLIGSLGASTLFADNVGGMGLAHPGVPQMSSGVAGIPGEYGGSGGYSHGWNGEEPGEHPHGYNQYGYGFGRHGGGVGEAGQGKSDTPQEPQEEQSSDNAQKKQFINAGPLGSLGPNPIADGISARLREGPLRTGRIGALAVPVRKFAEFGPRDGEGCYGDHCNDDYPTGPYPDGPADADFAPADVGDGVVHGVSIKQTHIKGRVAAATQVPVNVPAYAADVDSPVEGVVEEHRLGPIHSRVHHVAAVKELRIKEARPVAAIPVETDCSVGPCDEPALEDGPVDNTLVGGHVEGAVVTHEAVGVVGAAAPVEDGLVGPIAGPVGHVTRVTHHRRIYGNRFGGPVLHHTQRVTQSVAAVPVLEDTKDPKHVHVGVGTPNVKVEVETDRKSEVSEKMSEIKKIVSDVTSKIKKTDSKLKALKKSKTPKNGGKRQITPAFTPVTSEPAGVPDIRYPVPAADRYPLGAGYIWPSANYGHQYGGPYAWSKSSTPKAEAKKDKKKDKKGKKKSSTKTKRAAEVETKEKNETKSEDKKATKRQFLPHAGPAGMGFEHPAAGGSNYPYHGGNMDVYVY